MFFIYVSDPLPVKLTVERYRWNIFNGDFIPYYVFIDSVTSIYMIDRYNQAILYDVTKMSKENQRRFVRLVLALFDSGATIGRFCFFPSSFDWLKFCPIGKNGVYHNLKQNYPRRITLENRW